MNKCKRLKTIDDYYQHFLGEHINVHCIIALGFKAKALESDQDEVGLHDLGQVMPSPYLILLFLICEMGLSEPAS